MIFLIILGHFIGAGVAAYFLLKEEARHAESYSEPVVIFPAAVMALLAWPLVLTIFSLRWVFRG